MATPAILALDGAGVDAREVGGKAAGLDRLAAQGFPIPRSFVITAATYRDAVDHSGFGPWVAQLADRPVPRAGGIEPEVAEIEGTFARIGIDDEVLRDLEHVAAGLLEHGRVAVRSSATAEDLESASFAGQYRTVLGLTRIDQVVAAVKACWASLWLPAAREYRLRHEIEPDRLAMAVVVQHMVEAEWSGVGFTNDPSTDRGDMRIEAVEGLGESLVSGRVNPLDFLVRRDTLEVDGSARYPLPRHVEDLARLMLQIEDKLSGPQDIEWASRGDEIVLLQSRPITVVGPRTLLNDGFDGPTESSDQFTPHGVVEMLPGAVTPLLWSINGPMIEHGYRAVIDELGGDPGSGQRPFIGRFRGRAALNLSALRDVAAQLPGGSAADVERQFLGRVLTDGSEPKQRSGIESLFRVRRANRRLSDEVDLVCSAIEALVQLRIDVSELPAWRLAGYRHAVRDLAWRTTAAEIAASSAATASYRALTLVLRRWMGNTEAAAWAQRLTAGTLGRHAAGARLDRDLNAAYLDAVSADPEISYVIDAGSEGLADRVHDAGSVGAELASDVADAARIAGSRSVYGGVTWEESPELVWRRLHAIATRERDSAAAAMPSATTMSEVAARLQARRAWGLTRVLTGQIIDLRCRWVARQADEAAAMLRLRERAKSALLTLGGEERRIIDEIGARIVTSRQVASEENIALLSDRELEGMLLGAPAPPSAVMNWRRSVAYRVGTAPTLPEVFEGLPGVAARRGEEGPVLKGWAASPGRVAAVARVVEGFADADRLQPGEILVATATDPSWTPVLVEAAAVVLETGGPLSHAAILAREFGIPAVLNVPGATHLIRDDESIEVDGFAGEVRRPSAGAVTT